MILRSEMQTTIGPYIGPHILKEVEYATLWKKANRCRRSTGFCCLRTSGRWSWFGMGRPITFEMKNIWDKLRTFSTN